MCNAPKRRFGLYKEPVSRNANSTATRKARKEDLQGGAAGCVPLMAVVYLSICRLLLLLLAVHAARLVAPCSACPTYSSADGLDAKTRSIRADCRCSGGSDRGPNPAVLVGAAVFVLAALYIGLNASL